MGLIERKLVSSATRTSQKIEISLVARLHVILSKKRNNKGSDQTARMRWLVCTFAVRKPPKTGFLALRLIIMMYLFPGLFPLINVGMLTIVGIYEQDRFHAQLSLA